MTLEECLNKKVIIQEFESLDIEFNDKIYTFRVGDVIERLTIYKLVKYKEGNVSRKGCICLCICGNFIGPFRLLNLLNGDNISCGCYQRELHSKQMVERNTVHGYSTRDSREHLYVLWGAMIDRATNKNRLDSKYYSEKGITVCDEWRNYLNFREWSINNGYEEGLSLDRIDNSLGYSPENCRWIPLNKQNSNKTSNRILTYKDKSMTITDWCRETELSWSTINNRLKSGKTVGQALGFEN